ncbi:MAG: dihydrolipoamide acetyltransferase component of pyruvate dehydrogenase complex [Planctomycetaceae bacterium]|nr:MAG: dihydrolipoamide acetyltransferase component of pyruvate dehydrogenase complex [Planctomycetaceae bacterium]
MEEGVFVEWLRADGDTIEPGDVLFNLEGEKAIQEIESIDAGVLRIPADAPAEGDTVLVGQVIGWLCAEDEDPPAEFPAVDSAAADDGPPDSPPVPSAGPVETAVAAAPAPPTRRPASSPRARRVASELGVEWTTLAGSGRNGRIRERDVRAAAESGATVSSSTGSPSVRGVIAERMLTASQGTAAVTLTTTADATALVSLRKQFQATSGDEPAPGYNEILLKLTAIVLAEPPQVRSSWTETGVLAPAGDAAIDIGLAVDTDAGLVVPVIRDPGGATLKSLHRDVADLADRARTRQLTAAEMSGGVFTITNLGAHGIDAFTPILNLPQAAILGIGRIREVPVVRGEEIVPGTEISLSLTFDHRVLDGAPAATFLAEVVRAIENPGAMRARVDPGFHSSVENRPGNRLD